MKLKILTGAAALVVVTVALAIGAMTTASADTPNCITKSLDDDTCVWELELMKVEVAVEYEYPYCEVKLTVEDNLDEVPEMVKNTFARLEYIRPGESRGIRLFRYEDSIYSAGARWGIKAEHPHWQVQLPALGSIHRLPRYSHDSHSHIERLVEELERGLPQTTLGTIQMVSSVHYNDNVVSSRQVRVGNKFVHQSLPTGDFRSNKIPYSHTFAGLTEEIFTCFEVAKREHGRVEERSALDTEKAGLRQSLKLLEAELARAREHELDATNVLKEVIAISERVEEARRAIQRLRVEGIAERRKLIERYYAEESQRYSVFIKSLEASAAALAASDKAIAAHKAELEASRARLDALVTAAQEAEAELIAEIERAQEALGEDDD